MIEGHASVFVILVQKKTEETTSGHISITQTTEVLEELTFIHKLGQDLLYREIECTICKTKHFKCTCIRLVWSDPHQYLRRTKILNFALKVKRLR